MEDDPDTRSDDPEPLHERRDAGARSGDLARMSAEQADATFGDTGDAKARMPGVLSGEVGPKGKIAAQLRSSRRRERATYGEVPFGAASPGGFFMLLVPMLLIAVLIIGVVVLLGWLLS